MARQTITQVSEKLSNHEIECSERWKTAFNRFDDLDDRLNRLEGILLSFCGATILFLATTLVVFLTT